VFGKDNPLTNLVVKLDGVDPDDAFSSVPYEKGHSLLFYLETLLGGPSNFLLIIFVVVHHQYLRNVAIAICLSADACVYR